MSWHPPEAEAIAAVRVASLVEHLPAHGWHVTLVTRSPVDARGIGRNRLVVRDPVHELRNRNATNSSPLWRLVSAILFRMLTPDEQVWWSWRVAKLMRRSDFDAVLVTGPPFSQWLVLAARPQLAVLDYRDLWTIGPYFRSRGPKRWLNGHLERWAWRRASLATTVSQPLVDDLERSGMRARLVMNGVDEAETVEEPVATSSDGPLTLTYAGQLYGERRNPGALFEAVRLSSLRPDELRLIFYGPDPRAVEELANRHGISDWVEAHSSVSRAESIRHQRQSDVLLLLLWDDPREAGVVTGKLFEYVAARRPILMLGWEAGVAAALVRDRDLGVVSNDPNEIARLLRTWSFAKRDGGVHPIARENATGLSRADQVAALASLLHQAW